MSETELVDNLFAPQTNEAVADLDENSRRASREHKFELGTNVFRFLPALRGDKAVPTKSGEVLRAFHPIWTHRIEWFDGEGKGQFKLFRCPQKTHGKPCPLCIKLDAIKAEDPSQEANDFCYQNGPRQTFGARAINRLRPQDGIRPITFGISVMSDIKAAINAFRDTEEREAAAKKREPNPALWDVTHWRYGRDFQIVKSGANLNTEYKVTAQDKSPLVACEEDADGRPILFETGPDGKQRLLPAIQSAISELVEAGLEVDVEAEFYTTPDASKINLLLDEAVGGDVRQLMSKADSEAARKDRKNGDAGGGRGKGGAPRVIGAGAAQARSRLLGS